MIVKKKHKLIQLNQNIDPFRKTVFSQLFLKLRLVWGCDLLTSAGLGNRKPDMLKTDFWVRERPKYRHIPIGQALPNLKPDFFWAGTTTNMHPYSAPPYSILSS